MKEFLAVTLLSTFGLTAGAEIIDLKPRLLIVPVNTNSTETQEFENVTKQIPNPEEISEFQNDNETQPDFTGKPGLRITNGYMAFRGQFPWQVALIVDNSNFCGGSLISKTWVLTAAHCTGSFYHIRLGANIWDRKELWSLDVVSTRSIAHSNYNKGTYVNDIAVIRLPYVVMFSYYIRPVSLPRRFQENYSFVGARLLVSGWGRFSDKLINTSPHLLYVDVTAISNTACTTALATLGASITLTHLCVSTTGGRSPCQGDSGGPLVLFRYGYYTQVGIVSFGASDCEAGYPAAFTRVTSYLSWIQSVTGIPIF